MLDDLLRRDLRREDPKHPYFEFDGDVVAAPPAGLRALELGARVQRRRDVPAARNTRKGSIRCTQRRIVPNGYSRRTEPIAELAESNVLLTLAVGV